MLLIIFFYVFQVNYAVQRRWRMFWDDFQMVLHLMMGSSDEIGHRGVSEVNFNSRLPMMWKLQVRLVVICVGVFLIVGLICR